MLGRACRWAALAGALLLPLVLLPLPARADTVIYYSASENAYGWCAGYSYNRAHSCARGYCADQNATDCQLVLECADGWGAIAFAESPAAGVGMSCGMNEANFARTLALSNCMAVSNTMCWTDVTFNRNANTSSAESNRDFDLTWFSQATLQVRHYEPGTADGNFGPQTRTAIEEFQIDLGRVSSGFVDDELLLRLVDAVGGSQSLARILKRDVVDPNLQDLSANMYAYSGLPAAAASFSEQLMARPEDQRLMALAAVLASSDSRCSAPALSAQPLPDASSGMWAVECTEGSYTLILSDDGGSIIVNNSGSETPEPSQKVNP